MLKVKKKTECHLEQLNFPTIYPNHGHVLMKFSLSFYLSFIIIPYYVSPCSYQWHCFLYNGYRCIYCSHFSLHFHLLSVCTILLSREKKSYAYIFICIFTWPAIIIGLQGRGVRGNMTLPHGSGKVFYLNFYTIIELWIFVTLVAAGYLKVINFRLSGLPFLLKGNLQMKLEQQELILLVVLNSSKKLLVLNQTYLFYVQYKQFPEKFLITYW